MTSDYTSEIPTCLYRAADVRELDRIAIEEQGIPGIELMSRAGAAAFALLRARWPQVRHISVVCGTGNNGGDGFIVALLAKQAGLLPRLLLVGDSEKLCGDAMLARQMAERQGLSIQPFDPASLQSDLVVDGLLGTGLSGPVRGEQAAAIAAINRSGLPVLALDIPSGLCADTGAVLGVAIKAQATITFIGMKQGLLTAQAPEQVGALYFASLDVPSLIYSQVVAPALRVDEENIRHWLPPRPRTAHKGSHGHVLLVGGDQGMGGAVTLAAEAAGRVGAGLVSVATRPEHVTPLLTRRPECMVYAVDDLSALFQKASVVVIGPGLGQGDWGQQMLRQVLAADLPLVLDADALNLLALWKAQGSLPARRNHWILTPHPGEAARLLQAEVPALQQDRFAAVRRLQQEYAATVLLKGAGTLITSENEPVWLSCTGNPGMGTGGMGDVLSGVIGGLLAQGLTPLQAASAGAWLHGKAADILAQKAGERGLLASDLFPALQHWANLSSFTKSDHPAA